MTSVWIGIASVVVGAAGVGVSASQGKKARKANEKNSRAYFDAIAENEEEARKLFDGFMKGYNESAEKLEEGLTIEEYIKRQVTALNDPFLNEAYRKARNGDWEQAQQFADAANEQNISAFDAIVERVSGGDYGKMLEARNAAVLSEDAESLYKEANRIRSPRTPAGSVVRDDEGNVVGGQRADKFDFQISETAVREQNDRTFGKARVAIEDDRAAAARHQQRASEFLPFLDYSGFVNQGVVQPLNQASLQSQLAQLQAQAGLAAGAMGAALGAPVAPPTISTAASDAMTQESMKVALAGLADIYKSSQKTNTGTQPTTLSRAETSYNSANGITDVTATSFS